MMIFIYINLNRTFTIIIFKRCVDRRPIHDTVDNIFVFGYQLNRNELRNDYNKFKNICASVEIDSSNNFELIVPHFHSAVFRLFDSITKFGWMLNLRIPDWNSGNFKFLIVLRVFESTVRRCFPKKATNAFRFVKSSIHFYHECAMQAMTHIK